MAINHTRTPLKYSYGKRRRYTNTTDLSWDETIDRDPVQPAQQTTKETASIVARPLDVNESSEIPDETDFISPISSHKKPAVLYDVYDFKIKDEKADALRSSKKSAERTLTKKYNRHETVDDHTPTKRRGPLKPVQHVPAIRSSPRKIISPTAHKSALLRTSTGKFLDKGKGKDLSLLHAVSSDTATSVSTEVQSAVDLALAISNSRSETVRNTEDLDQGRVDPAVYKTRTTRFVAQRSPKYDRPLLKQHSQSESSLSAIVPAIDANSAVTSVMPDNGVDLEIDLESITRTQTPVLRAPIVSNTPQPSPQRVDISDLFDINSPIARSSIQRPRRLLQALRRARPDTLSKSREVPDSEEDIQSLGKLLESAESNLYDQSQKSEAGDYVDATEQSTQIPVEHDSPSMVEQKSQPTRMTYSKQRSFLLDVPASEADGDQLFMPRAPSPVLNTDDDDSGDETPAVTIKTLHELRQGGENKRFIGEASYLLEGLDTTNTIQSTLIELAHKLSAKDFAKKFRAADLDETIWRSCKNVDDPLSLFCLMVISTILLQIGDSAKISNNQASILTRAIAYSKDIKDYAMNRSIKASRMNKSAVMELRSEVAKSEAFSGFEKSYQLSPRLLALITLNLCLLNGLDGHKFVNVLLDIIADYAIVSSAQLVEIQMISSILEQLQPNLVVQSGQMKLESLTHLMVATLSIEDPVGTSKSLALCSFFRCFISLVNIAATMSPILSNVAVIDPLLEYVVQACTNCEKLDPPDELALCLGLLICLAEEFNVTRKVLQKRMDNLQFLDIMTHVMHIVAWRSIGGYIALLQYHSYHEQLVSRNSNDHHTQQEREALKKGLECLLDSKEFVEDNSFRSKLTADLKSIL